MKPIVAVVLMVTLAVIAGLVAYTWVVGYTGISTIDRTNPVDVEITSNIYKTNPNYGALGENNTFWFHTSNTSNETQKITIIFHTLEYDIFGANLTLFANSGNNAAISSATLLRRPLDSTSVLGQWANYKDILSYR